MHRLAIIVALCALIAVPLAAAAAQVTPIDTQTAKTWSYYTVPLPKQMEITSEISAPRGSVRLEIAGDQNRPCYDEIRSEFSEACGTPGAGPGEVAIKIQVGGDQAEPLKKLDNASQAYSISADSGQITISALSYRGAFYGWQTLRQLINGRSTTDSLRIPVLKVTDWPDMEQRGLWGTDSNNRLDWLSARKMNHEEQIMNNGMLPDGTFYAGPRDFHKTLAADCERYATDFAPVVLHLEQVLTPAMEERYPQIKAKKATHDRALCYSERKTVEMIAQWIYDLANDSSDHEVDVWMSENLAGKYGCQCEGCKEAHHSVNEARAIVKAWGMAKQKLGADIPLYVLTSEATEANNPEIFSIYPKEVRIWYYHSLFTYNTMRRPMLKPYLAEEVKKGRWMGVCPNLDAWTHINSPLTSAPFINYRMTEFQSKGLKGLLGYATPRVQFSRFNVEAAAEWAWNLKGRTPREFAYSWAVRQGYKDPDKFVEWEETVGQLGWDIYGSGWPVGQGKKRPEAVKTALKNGNLPPLGTVQWDAYPTPWGNIANEAQLNQDIAQSQKAISLARELGKPELMYETLIDDGYIRSLKALWELRKLAPKGHTFAMADQAKARTLFEEFFSSLKQSEEYLPKWEACVKVQGEEHGFVGKPIALIKDIVDGVKQEAAKMGVEM